MDNKLRLLSLAMMILLSPTLLMAQEGKRMYLLPITVGDFKLMPDTILQSSFKVGMLNAVTRQRGFSAGALFNINHSLHGIQMAGITNISSGVEKGVQMAAAVNVSAGYNITATSTTTLRAATVSPSGSQPLTLSVDH